MAVPLAAAAPPLLLTLDLGSSSARASLYDGRGRAVADVAAQRSYQLEVAPDGRAVDGAEAAIARAGDCLDELLGRLGPAAGRIGAVAVATMASTLVAVDGAGLPLSPLISYADRRDSPDAVRLRTLLDEAAIHERTGCPLRSSYWPARLAWFRRSQPERWARVAHWLTLGEYLERQWFGRCRVSRSLASWGGLLNRHTLTWDAELLAVLSLSRAQLSPLVEHDEPLHGLAAPYAERWPALRALPWFPTIGDGAAATIGSGATTAERMALTIGTSAALRLLLPTVRRVPPGLWCYYVDRAHALLGGATNEGGNLYAWLRQTLRLGSPDEIEAALATAEPDGHGLTVLPFVAGERSPGWAGNVPATIHGLTLATRPLAILHASLEAVAYRLALIARRLAEAGAGEALLVASGSALTRSPAWMQIVADVLGRPVVASAEGEATSRGAALMALHALGGLPSWAALPAAEGARYDPDAARHARYQEAIARQQWLYERLLGEGDPSGVA